MQFVLDDSLSRQGAHGVPAGKHQKSSLGSTMRIDLNQPIAGGKMSYSTYFYVSTNYEQNNYVEWQNTFNIIAAKIFNVGFFCRMVYNEHQATPGTDRFNGPTKSGSDCPIRSKTSSFGYGNCPCAPTRNFR